MQAAEALCPHEARLYAAGGAARDAAVRESMGGWADLLDPDAEGWLAQCLHRVLCARPDLVLTGRDLTQGIQAERVRIPGEILRAAITPGGVPRVGLDLRLSTGRVDVVYSFSEERPDLPTDVELLDGRVELAEPIVDVAAAPARRGQHAYSEEACRGWFDLRVATWQGPPPSEKACMADAQAYFSTPISRAKFREIRREQAPDWCTPGPRVGGTRRRNRHDKPRERSSKPL